MTALALLLVMGCSVHDWQHRVYSRKMTRALVTEHTVSLGEATVHYWRGADDAGPPLLLLHGFGGDALFTWTAQLPLAERHQLIAPDLLWFGESHAESPRSLRTQVTAFLALLDHEGIEKADIVGISYGGVVASQLAIIAPERVDRLVIVDSPGPTYTDAQHQAMLDRLGIADAAELVVPSSHRDVRGLIELAYYRPPPTPGFVLRDIYTHMFTTYVGEKGELLAELEQNREGFRAMDWNIPHPTLLVWGEHDILFPVSVGEDYQSAIGSNARLAVIPKTNHAPNIEGRRVFNPLLEDFLAR